VVTSLPLSPYRVRLEGEAEALGPVREAIGRSLDVRESTGDADFRLQARNGAFWILRPADDRPLTAEVPGSGPAEAALVVARLEHIARWTRYATLENPSSRIRTSDVDLRLFLDDGQEEVTALEVRLRAKRKKGKLVSPRFRVRVRNAGEQVLYVGILAMDELFSISTDWFPEGVVKLEPGQEVWALGGKAVTASIAPSLREAGAVETRDILKLIACTSDFEVRLAAQGALDAPRRRAAGFDAARPSTLNRLLERGQTRTLSAEPADDEEIQDFLTKAVTITVVEPRERVAISRTDPAELGGQVVIERHPSLLAKARLTTVSESRSDLGNAVLPPLFRDDPMGWEPLRFSTARGSDPGLTVLELSEVQEHTSISDQAPLMVKVPVVLQEGEAILAVGFDGDLYLPLGWSRRHANHTEVRLERLPHPVAQQARSLTGSIRILFQKLVGARLGRPYAYPLLAAAAWDAEGGVSYVRDVDAVRQKVSSAERVVLFVHGIIGDTEGIGARLRLRPGKDVALTFDYENLHTTIEENARGLKQRLDEVGLPQGHAKELVIVAHSMGGLVSRWFIEKEGGKDVVSRLLLCGTPNGGSPWPTVQDWVTSAVAMALNGLTAVAWPAAAVGWLLSGLERLDNSLDQMKPGSALLTELARAPDPKRPYTILAGSTSLAPEAGPRWRQLAQRLFHRALSAAFLFEPNDIAVSVASIGQVDRRRAPAPRVVEVACDHLTYFRAPAGLAALQEALGG
jgi:pimeloyl-ACP methyl ester carboxylesterase